MRNKNIAIGTLGRVAGGIVAAVLLAGSSSYGGGPSGETPAGGGAAKGGGGGQAVNPGGNAAPAAKPAAPAARAEPAPTGTGSQTGGGKSPQENTNPANPKVSPANQLGSTADRGHNRRSDFYSEGEIYGNPWSPYAYGWYGEEYPYGANFSEPVYTNPSNTAQTDNGNPSAISNSPAPTAILPNAAKLANAVDKSPAMIAANDAVQSAQAAYDGERNRVLLGLKDKPEYQQALARKQTAAAKVDAVKTDAPANSTPAPALTNAATVKMDASSEVTKMEEQAIAGDPNASAAKSKLNEAIADRDALRAKLLAEH